LNMGPVTQRYSKEAVRSTLDRFMGLQSKSLHPNKAQQESMALCAGSTIHYVWGPPGTGKTVNLAQVTATLVGQGERVLVLAHANVAVDVAILRIAQVFKGSPELDKFRILRLGIPQLPEVREQGSITPEDALKKSHPDLVRRRDYLERSRDQITKQISSTTENEEKTILGRELKKLRKELADVREQIRAAIKTIIAEARVLCGTLSRYAFDNQLFMWPADAVLVDEASMAPFPALLAAGINTHKRMIIFGDFRQLPPIVLSSGKDTKDWLGRDAFEIAGIMESVDTDRNDPRLTLLETQYRMSERIAAVVSSFAYGGKLKTGDGVDKRNAPISRLMPYAEDSVILLDTTCLDSICIKEPKYGSFSRANPIHAALSVEIADSLLDQGCPNVAIVTPYRAQARLVTSFLHEHGLQPRLRAATVHRFQGSESEAVIVDLVDGPPIKGASKLTGKDRDNSRRLLNVAVSRAKGKLFVLANEDFIRQTQRPAEIMPILLARLRDLGARWRLLPHEIFSMQQGKRIQWFERWEECEASICKVLADAHSHFFLNLPGELKYSTNFLTALHIAANRVNNSTIFSNPSIAETLEDTRADIRLMTRSGGFFLLADGITAIVGGTSGSGAFFRVDQKRAAASLSELFLGEELDGLGPRADIRHSLDALCGRCPECGEFRRPRKSRGQQWKLACMTGGHSSEEINIEILQKMINLLNIRCAKCEGKPILRKGPKGLFIGCHNYSEGCLGDFPSLENIFEEN